MASRERQLLAPPSAAVPTWTLSLGRSESPPPASFSPSRLEDGVGSLSGCDSSRRSGSATGSA